MQSDSERGQWTSASSAEQDSLCPGRHKAQLGLPEETTPESESGTRIHAYLAGQSVSLTEDEQELAEACQAAFRLAFSQWHPGKGEGGTIAKENRLWLRFENGVRHSGKPDVLAIQDSRALVCDYKTGRSEVAPNNRNLQLRDLAVLASYAHQVTEVTVKIIQPLAPDAPPCLYELRDLAAAVNDLEDRVIACNAPNPRRIPGETQCRYCRAKKQCPEFAAAGLPMDVVPSYGSVEEAKSLLPDRVAAMPGDRLARAWTLAKMLVSVAEAELRQRIADGKDAGGAYLEPGNVVRPIEKVQEAYQRALEDGMTPQAFMACVSASKGDLEKALKDVHRSKIGKDRLPKGYWEPIWKQFCDGICGEKQNAPSLKWSDKQLAR